MAFMIPSVAPQVVQGFFLPPSGYSRIHAYTNTRIHAYAHTRPFKGPVKDCLQNAYPGRSKFTLLEDNDPTGFRSRAGVHAKEEAGFKVLQIPRRSPQLNMCDHSLWKEVEKHMRAQEKRFLPSFRESLIAFLKRLRRTAMRLPSPSSITV